MNFFSTPLLGDFKLILNVVVSISEMTEKQANEHLSYVETCSLKFLGDKLPNKKANHQINYNIVRFFKVP